MRVKNILMIAIVFVVILLLFFTLLSRSIIAERESHYPTEEEIEAARDKTVEQVMDRFYGKEYCDNLRNVIKNKGEEIYLDNNCAVTTIVKPEKLIEEENTYYEKMADLYEKEDVTTMEKLKIRQELKSFFDKYKNDISDELYTKIDNILAQKYIEE